MITIPQFIGESKGVYKMWPPVSANQVSASASPYFAKPLISYYTSS